LLAQGVKIIVANGAGRMIEARPGLIRYCPICDGLRVCGKRVAVLGCSDHGAAEALVRHYSETVTLLAQDSSQLSEAEKADLARGGIAVERALSEICRSMEDLIAQ
jgi:thioredoxin reductase (NADPH)